VTAGGPWRRNLIHLATAAAAPCVRHLPPPWPHVGLGLALAAAASLDVARRRPGPRRRLDAALPGVFRTDETATVSGATLLGAGYLAAALAFPAAAAAGGIAALAVGDPAAALAGRRFGARRGAAGAAGEAGAAGSSRAAGKSWPGSLACFVAATPAIWLAAGATVPAAVAAGAFGALVERCAGRWDNLAMPSGIAALLTVWPLAG